MCKPYIWQAPYENNAMWYDYQWDKWLIWSSFCLLKYAQGVRHNFVYKDEKIWSCIDFVKVFFKGWKSNSMKISVFNMLIRNPSQKLGYLVYHKQTYILYNAYTMHMIGQCQKSINFCKS